MLHFGLETLPYLSGLERPPGPACGCGQDRATQSAWPGRSGARLTVVAPEWDPEFESLPIELVRRRFRATDLSGVLLVFAATNDRLTNHRIGIAAKGKSILANIVDSAEECDFVVPARVRRDNIQIAVSTGGENPRLSAELRRRLEALI